MASYWDRFDRSYARLGGRRFWLGRRCQLVEGLSGRVLEVCCGGGHLVVQLLRQGCDAYGIDLSAGMVALAREELGRAGFDPERIAQADVTALPFADGEFDAVVSTGSLGLLPRTVQRSALAEMARVARAEIRLLEPLEKQSGMYLGRLLAFTFDRMRPIPQDAFAACGLNCQVEWDALGGAFSAARCTKSKASS